LQLPLWLLGGIIVTTGLIAVVILHSIYSFKAIKAYQGKLTSHISAQHPSLLVVSTGYQSFLLQALLSIVN
jgi:hypothetical protein